MAAERIIRFGVIGCGLMGREFASAAARWCHLQEMDVTPRIVAVCDANPAAMTWFSRALPDVRTYTDYHDVLADAEVEAVYCAVPHHLHQQLYVDILRAGKHLLGEKPFGIDREAYQAVAAEIAHHSDLLVRCSSEYPYFPGALQLFSWAQEGRFGRVFEVEAGYWHCSDLNPQRPISWKRRIATCGEYGCMGDLGMHALHLPLRIGWRPANVRALLTKIVKERPGPDGQMVPCETWDNAILALRGRGIRSDVSDDGFDEANRAGASEQHVPAHSGHRLFGGVFDAVSQANPLSAVCAGRRAGVARGGCAVSFGLSDDYRRHL